MSVAILPLFTEYHFSETIKGEIGFLLKVLLIMDWLVTMPVRLLAPILSSMSYNGNKDTTSWDKGKGIKIIKRCTILLGKNEHNQE